jgi:hypothetical protein
LVIFIAFQSSSTEGVGQAVFVNTALTCQISDALKGKAWSAMLEDVKDVK